MFLLGIFYSTFILLLSVKSNCIMEALQLSLQWTFLHKNLSISDLSDFPPQFYVLPQSKIHHSVTMSAFSHTSFYDPLLRVCIKIHSASFL